MEEQMSEAADLLQRYSGASDVSCAIVHESTIAISPEM